ncbi:YciE/YciF ferroxidase family protein [Mucilaginibacter ginsenosidivorax]|uniref:Ferritin-like domain-containing protein n=1 Tax=Mucilaginibacter ginsenosidivorax TaxID=862126 RepID=A0A5B8VYV9_9SPHI|nr:ferritin-like domain-containing protein [Mucilaginibacter ginsenosidivorax]QEC76481.1 ferritin-like domain-containing protein [Mucilaginibacter ginsenosidivorax]
MATTKTKAPEQTLDVQDSALNELFIDELKDIYWAEKHLAKALPKMAKAATSDELRAAIENHLSETERQITRLEDAFASIDEKAVAVKCEAMAGLLKEGEEIITETEKGSITRDAGIISAAQKIEHYEIASYGTLKTLATVLGYNEAAELLDSTLQEEKNCDSLLTKIAEAGINQKSKTEKA